MLRHGEVPKIIMTSLVDKTVQLANFHEVLSFTLSLQVCAAKFESREYYSMSTCTTAVHNFQKPYMYSSFYSVYCHMLFSFVCTAGMILLTVT